MTAEFVLDTPVVRSFVADVQAAIAARILARGGVRGDQAPVRRAARRPGVAPGRLPAAAPESGMGGGIGQWLLYRAEDGSLSLFSLVVPPGSQTPIHDHLAWGLVGLYRGTQDEEIYARRDGALELVERRSLAPGDFYALIPPHDDIHRVRTTSAETSVSIHLLTNDTGCVWRHTYEPGSGEARPFRSGYVNVACDDGTHRRTHADPAPRRGRGRGPWGPRPGRASTLGGRALRASSAGPSRCSRFGLHPTGGAQTRPPARPRS